MTKDEAVEWFGSQGKLANFLNVYQSNVSAWKKIPAHHQTRIEEKTGGELVADRNLNPMKRFQGFIPRDMLEGLTKEATRQGLPMTEIVRKALKEYLEKKGIIL